MTTLRRIAMWSGPRNISTALMRAWENRPDTHVHDEPLYAHYLRQTGLPHPGAAEVIAAYPTDWREVVDQLTGPLPDGISIYYQKHMTHHMLPNIGREWMLKLTNCFLIRDPGQVIVSLAKVLGTPTIDQTGIPQQHELFTFVQTMTKETPPVIDSADVLADPQDVLSKLCAAVDVPFDEAMLSWPPGPRESDGNWAPYWYASVEQSTGFMPPLAEPAPVPPELQPLVDECMPLYDQMREHAIR